MPNFVKLQLKTASEDKMWIEGTPSNFQCCLNSLSFIFCLKQLLRPSEWILCFRGFSNPPKGQHI